MKITYKPSALTDLLISSARITLNGERPPIEYVERIIKTLTLENGENEPAKPKQ